MDDGGGPEAVLAGEARRPAFGDGRSEVINHGKVGVGGACARDGWGRRRSGASDLNGRVGPGIGEQRAFRAVKLNTGLAVWAAGSGSGTDAAGNVSAGEHGDMGAGGKLDHGSLSIRRGVGKTETIGKTGNARGWSKPIHEQVNTVTAHIGKDVAATATGDTPVLRVRRVRIVMRKLGDRGAHNAAQETFVDHALHGDCLLEESRVVRNREMDTVLGSGVDHGTAFVRGECHGFLNEDMLSGPRGGDGDASVTIYFIGDVDGPDAVVSEEEIEIVVRIGHGSATGEARSECLSACQITRVEGDDLAVGLLQDGFSGASLDNVATANNCPAYGIHRVR